MLRTPEKAFQSFIKNLSRINVEPKTFNKVSEIVKINIAHCQTGKFPPFLEKMDNLEELNLSGNNLLIIDKSLWKATNLKRLFLFANKLEYIDEEIQNLKGLEEFNIGSNELSELPEGLGELENLYSLSLSANNFKILPKSLNRLKKLRDLRLRQVKNLALESICEVFSDYQKAIYLGSFGYNINIHNDFLQISISKINSLPNKIGLLKSIQKIHFPFSNVSKFPFSFFNLSLLLHLNLRSNRLTEIPVEIGKVNSIRTIDLRCNGIEKIPNSISKCENLEELLLSQNSLKEIPIEIGNLGSLRKLNLSNNSIDTIPKEIGNLSTLEELNLSSNNLKELPHEIQKLKSLKRLWLVGNDFTETERNRIKACLPDCFILFTKPFYLDDDRTRYLRPHYPILKKGFFIKNCDKNGYFLVKDKDNCRIHIKLSGKQRINYTTFKENELIYFCYDSRTTEGHFVNGTNFKMNPSLFEEKLWLDNNENEN